ncbi:DUF6515 family protein [Aureibaculum sp. 2210JD6-5]|uniref:DUF6515 family protein n=1 Tax=Aureibaculum sp. 2210JD6-5 TaxID=3103957 RepID=UPI002AADFF6D|nr:DUF6515 family protein [Aureibaculum sp. 2210JD6-5]MDY7396538.1 DUF6515 family protein [Aureibaculum sp. 2210JD6-5]
MKNLIIILLISILSIFSTSCVTTVRPAQVHTKTVVVKKAPKHHKVVYVKGYRYYTWGGKYYKKTRKGYIVVKF